MKKRARTITQDAVMQIQSSETLRTLHEIVNNFLIELIVTTSERRISDRKEIRDDIIGKLYLRLRIADLALNLGVTRGR